MALPPIEHDLPPVPLWLRHGATFTLKACGWTLGPPPPPGLRKAVSIAAPHTSNWDFVWALLACWSFGMQVSWLGKDSLFKPPLGWLLRPLGGVSVDRSAPHGLVGEVARTFREADRLLLLVPAEGTRKRTEYWKSGFYWMAKEADVPILCGYLDYEKGDVGFGLALRATGEIADDMEVIAAFYEGRKGRYPECFGPIRLRESSAPASTTPEAR